MKLFIAAVVYLTLGSGGDSSHEIMKQSAVNFGKAFEECKKEHNLPDSVQIELMNFWKEDSVTNNRLIGCAMLCLSNKLNLVDESGKLHHDRAHEFAISHGHDDAMAKTLINLLHECENSVPDDPDNCMKVLEISKCFKYRVHKLTWAPSKELMMEEVLSKI